MFIRVNDTDIVSLSQRSHCLGQGWLGFEVGLAVKLAKSKKRVVMLRPAIRFLG